MTTLFRASTLYLCTVAIPLGTSMSWSVELATELQEHVKQVTTLYKYPREIEFVEALPKTISGKIRRVELRERKKKLRKNFASERLFHALRNSQQ